MTQAPPVAAVSFHRPLRSTGGDVGTGGGGGAATGGGALVSGSGLGVVAQPASAASASNAATALARPIRLHPKLIIRRTTSPHRRDDEFGAFLGA
jgi:hypothetical protein